MPEYTPELNQSVFDSLKRKRQTKTADDVAAARESAVKSGQTDSPWLALKEQAAINSESTDLADQETRLALEGAERARQDRVRKEDQAFSAGENEKSRGFVNAQRVDERSFLNSQQDKELAAQKDSDLAGGGLSLLGGMLGRGGIGGRGFNMGLGGEGGEVPGGGGLGGMLGGLGKLGGIGGVAGLGDKFLGAGSSMAGGAGGFASGALNLLGAGGAAYGGAKLGRALGLQGQGGSKTQQRGEKAGNVVGGLGGLIGGSFLGSPTLGAGIGSALGGAVGGQVAKAASSVSKAIKKICFGGDTLVSMEDGSVKKIKDIILGDRTLGGVVQSISQSIGTDIHMYYGVIVTGSHAVKEAGRWLRVGDSILGVKLDFECTVYSLITEKHRIYVNEIEFADFWECEGSEDLTLDECIDRLNGEVTTHIAGLNSQNGVVHFKEGN